MVSRDLVAALLLATIAEACGASAAQQRAAPRPQETGSSQARIDLELIDVPVEDALRALAEKAHINLDAAGSHLTGAVTIHVRAKPWNDVLAMIANDHGLRVTTTGSVVRVSNASDPPPENQSFTGTPIEASFDNTPIRTAVKTIADLAGAKITVDDGVDVAVTLHLRRVPWDFALDHLVRKYGLKLIRDEGRLRIARP